MTHDAQGALVIEAKRQAGVTLLDPFERVGEEHLAGAGHRDAVGDALHLTEEVRRGDDRPALHRDGAKDGGEDVASNDGIEPRRRLVEDEEIRPVCESGNEACAGALPFDSSWIFFAGLRSSSSIHCSAHFGSHDG